MNIRWESVRLGASIALIRRLRWALPIAMACLVSACGPPQPETRKWTEDVQIAPDRVIQVQRTAVFDESNALGGGAYNAVEREATISFMGDLAQLPMWKQPLMALVLYQDPATQEWVIVATTTSCQVWNAHGEPTPIYWEFRMQEGKWQEVPLSEASIGRGKNLLHRYQRRFDVAHVTIDYRREREVGMDRRFSEVLRAEKVYCARMAR